MSHTLVFCCNNTWIFVLFKSIRVKICLWRFPCQVLSELLTFTHLRRFSQKAFGKVSTQHSDRIYGLCQDRDVLVDELVTLYWTVGDFSELKRGNRKEWREEKVQLFSQPSAAESLGLGKPHPAGPTILDAYHCSSYEDVAVSSASYWNRTHLCRTISWCSRLHDNQLWLGCKINILYIFIAPNFYHCGAGNALITRNWNCLVKCDYNKKIFWWTSFTHMHKHEKSFTEQHFQRTSILNCLLKCYALLVTLNQTQTLNLSYVVN